MDPDTTSRKVKKDRVYYSSEIESLQDNSGAVVISRHL